MKAFILAAGLGTRLRSLGLNLPKVMVPIGGQPLLQHHLEWLRQQGITEVVINLHYLPQTITDYFGDGRAFGVTITYSHEPEILGTAGGVKKMEPLLRNAPFLVIYGDNLIRMDLEPLRALHRDRQAIATLALFASPEPWTGGVVETDPTGRVTAFREKPDPATVTTGLINAGVYVLEPAIFDFIPAGRFCDFGRDVFPRLLDAGKPVYAIKPLAYIQDIGTPERLARARRDYENGLVPR
jgi:NDP-sugar pyrophosphorylase family protein